MAPIRLQHRRHIIVTTIRIIRANINTHLNLGQQPIPHLLHKINKLRERIVVIFRLGNALRILRIARNSLRVGVVWVSGFSCGAESLGPEELSYVRHGTALDSAV